MISVTNQQLIELDDSLDRNFRTRLAQALLEQDPSLGSLAAAAAFMDQHIGDACQFNFVAPPEIAAYVLAVQQVGQERLIVTPAFSVAVFDRQLTMEDRSEALMDALDEALEMGIVDAAQHP